MVSQRQGKGQTADMAKATLDPLTGLLNADLAALCGGGLSDCAHAIVAHCRRLASIDEACLYLLPAKAVGPRGAQGLRLFSTGERCFTDLMHEGPASGPLARAASSGKAFYLDSECAEIRSVDAFAGMNADIRAAYVMPLGLPHRVVGVLCTGTFDAGGIGIEIRRTLDLLAPQLALALENAQLRQQLKILAPQGTNPRYRENPEAAAFSTASANARLAHDIKNSMTTVSTFIQLLPVKWDNEHFRTSFYPVARDETNRVNRLVSVMLDRGKQQHARVATVDLHAVLNKLLALKSPLAEQRRLRIRVHVALTVPDIRIEKAAIEEAVVNLLTNAIEASPEGGSIDIRLEDDALPSGRPAIRLEIQDSGPGIDETLQGAIFAPYVSTKTGSAMAGGTGLGLSIARHHIEAHGGTIAVESPGGAGALFRVVLPVERRQK